MIFGEWRRWLNNLSRNTRGRATGRQWARSALHGLEVLDGRVVPAVVVVDNPGDYTITNDQGAIGTLDNGDIVTWNPGAGSAHGGQVENLTFGTHAFTSVQAAVNAATAGDMIRVGSGTFAEKVTVSKQLTLLGNRFGVDAHIRSGVPETVMDGSTNNGWTRSMSPPTTHPRRLLVRHEATCSATASCSARARPAQVLNNVIQDNIIACWLTTRPGGRPHPAQPVPEHTDRPGRRNATYTDQYVAGPVVTSDVDATFDNTAPWP